MKIYILIIMLTLAKSASGQGFGKDISENPVIDSMQQALNAISSKSIDEIHNKYKKLTKSVQAKSLQLVKNMQKKEASLIKKVQGLDSLKARELFEGNKEKYLQVQSEIKCSVDKVSSRLKEYIPGLDSTKTTISFLLQPSLGNVLGTDKSNKLYLVKSTIQEFEVRFQQANEIQDFIRIRTAELKEGLLNKGLGKELLSINKEVYYYGEQLKEYKSILNDKKKLEKRLIASLRTIPVFKDFMEKHSYLAMLFPLPENYDASNALNGLQTRSGVQQEIAQRIGSIGSVGSPQQFMQQQVLSAQVDINKLKEKVSQLGDGSGNSEMTIPDFHPDKQKTKPFLQRLEYGINIQNTRGSYLLPVISDVGASLGYKASDRISFGIGTSFKLGWGTGWNNISLSSQGIALRSYLDIKAKGNLWASSGFEYNYMQAFSKIEQIANVDVWQKSILAGVTKKIKFGKNRESKVQLLYDFLANKQIPVATNLKFRMGWSF